MQVKNTALFFIMFFSIFLLTEHIHADEAIINVDDLNIRNGPGLEYEKIGQVNSEEVYQILQQQDEWVEIQFNNNTGWVTAEFISIQTDSNNEKPSADTVAIQYDNTHIRSKPDSGSDIIHFAEKGAVYNVISEQDEWYEIENGDVTGFINKQLIKEDAAPSSTGFKNKTIVIDAGHGGRDVGAIGANGSYEKDIAYLTAEELASELATLGAEVLLTRPEDEFISLGSRVSYANIMDTDAFISIHYNSVPDLPNVNGTETYYYHEQYEQLADYIQKEIVKETNAQNRGKTYGDFFVIRQTFKPSVLLELGFISNEEKEALLHTNAYQKKIVSGIVNGLGKYFANE